MPGAQPPQGCFTPPVSPARPEEHGHRRLEQGRCCGAAPAPRDRGTWPGPCQPPVGGGQKSSTWVMTLIPLERMRNFSWSLGRGWDCRISQGPSPGAQWGAPRPGANLAREVWVTAEVREARRGQALLPVLSTSPSPPEVTQQPLASLKVPAPGTNSYGGESRSEKPMPSAAEDAGHLAPSGSENRKQKEEWKQLASL